MYLGAGSGTWRLRRHVIYRGGVRRQNPQFISCATFAHLIGLLTADTGAQMTVSLPMPVREHIRAVFDHAGAEASSRMERAPNTHEESLDMALIDEIAKRGVPTGLPDGWIVRIDTHFLGGGRHWRNWEIADIGALVTIRLAGKPALFKVVLLQSKRLYPIEIAAKEEKDLVDYEIGFGGLLRGHHSYPAITQVRQFSFSADSQYRALEKGDRQWVAMDEYTQHYNIPLHYLLYHPGHCPLSATVPTSPVTTESTSEPLGCRVVGQPGMVKACVDLADGRSPSLGQVLGPAPGSTTFRGFGLGEFFGDEVLSCREGYIATKERDSGLDRIFSRRSGPISAAIAVTIDGPGARPD